MALADNAAFRIPIANRVLDCFAPGTIISHSPGIGMSVSWEGNNGMMHRRWQTRGQDFYPTWSNKWGHGGTACTALSQLVRWVQGKPVLPLSTWRHWFGDKCLLARDRGDEGLKHLACGKYPDEAVCVLCKQPIVGGLDWWSLNGVSGPCCGWKNGCRQKLTQPPAQEP